MHYLDLYNSGELLLRSIAPGGVTNTYTYQPPTNSPSDYALTAITFPDGTHQFYAWDAHGRLAAQYRDGNTERLEFAYGSDGLVTVRDALGNVSAVRLGDRGQLL